jgi:hypothetical protein
MWSRLETWWIWVGIAVRVSQVKGVAPARDFIPGQPVKKVCGVFTGAAGVKLSASLVDREHVNMGTTVSLPCREHNPVSWCG